MQSVDLERAFGSVFFKTFIEIAEAVNRLKLKAVSNFSLFSGVKPFSMVGKSDLLAQTQPKVSNEPVL